MKTLRRTRNAVYALTTGLWLVLCWAFWRRLIEEAADAGEIYARTPGFQALNFAVQYLWFFLLVLLAALAVEWVVFRVAEWAVSRFKRQAV